MSISYKRFEQKSQASLEFMFQGSEMRELSAAD